MNEFIKEIVKDVSKRVIVSHPYVPKYPPAEYENDFIGRIVEEFPNKINGGAPLHDESQLLEISLLLNEFDVKVYKTSKKFLEAEVRVWRLVGLVSSVVGLLCYALSRRPPLLHTSNSDRGNPLKIVLYGVLAFAIWAIILFAKHRPFLWQGKITAFVGFVVFMLTNVYSFYFDKAMNGKPDVLSMVSNGAFALTSLSLSKMFKFGFDMGIFSGFLTLLAA